MKIPNYEMCEMCFLSDEEDCMCKSKKFYLQGRADEREKTIEECKEVVRQHWINGTVAHRIAEEIYGDLEKLKEQK